MWATISGFDALPAASSAGSVGMTKKMLYVRTVATKKRNNAHNVRRMTKVATVQSSPGRIVASTRVAPYPEADRGPLGPRLHWAPTRCGVV